MLNALSLGDKKTLLVLDQVNKNVLLSAQNVPTAKVVLAEQVNTYDVLNADNVILSESSVDKLNNILN